MNLLIFSSKCHDSKIQFQNQAPSEGTSNHVRAVAKEFITDINKGEDAKEFSSLSRELQKKTNKPIGALFTDLGERVLDIWPLYDDVASIGPFCPLTSTLLTW